MDAVKGGRGPAPRTLDGRTRQSSTLIAVIEMSQSRSCRRSTYHAVMVETDVALAKPEPTQACPWLEQGVTVAALLPWISDFAGMTNNPLTLLDSFLAKP